MLFGEEHVLFRVRLLADGGVKDGPDRVVGRGQRVAVFFFLIADHLKRLAVLFLV